ncbi:uncharacterized protein MELLADRAFT_62736 [Melampsora larici-populina 98AG31]|uniref:Uncharacterized protein n=1 Tax=Melampsora larici-populina (strain 98AG31 / pathotype 3-4-7) TaxID=747676 RepID=F4RK14_MELLP|nr:uncharacterized protein MELLADRAFT_62736 [Melampsora larici-populina 98AG31]EGG07022.1 hypothetical protein MELLADRAFT_62736 [Melampsora larici-populina 98AG31]
MVGLVGSTKAKPADRLNESKNILRGIVGHLRQDFSRLWMSWNCGMPQLLDGTAEYSQMLEPEEALLTTRWAGLVETSRLMWKANSQAEIVEATPMDEGELAEQHLANLDEYLDEDNGEEDDLEEVNKNEDVDSDEGIDLD